MLLLLPYEPINEPRYGVSLVGVRVCPVDAGEECRLPSYSCLCVGVEITLEPEGGGQRVLQSLDCIGGDPLHMQDVRRWARQTVDKRSAPLRDEYADERLRSTAGDQGRRVVFATYLETPRERSSSARRRRIARRS